MRKDSFLQLGEGRNGFEIVSRDWVCAPKNLTTNTLWKLWDTTVKLGFFLDEGIAFKYDQLYMEAYDFRNSRGVAALFIARFNGKNSPFENDTFVFNLENGIRVSWDKAITVSEAKMIMAEVDLEALADGYLVDNKRGVIIDPIEAKKKLNVQKSFDKSRSVCILPPNTDAKFALSCFDRPELLDIIVITPHIHVICLRSEKKLLAGEFLEKLAKLKEMGLSPEEIEKMSFEEIVKLKKNT